MAVYVNGKHAEFVTINGIRVKTVIMNGIIVYTTHGNVTIDYNSVSGNNPETVTGSNGSFTFTPPTGVTRVTICMVGGGGSGEARSHDAGVFYIKGGNAGTVVSQDVTVSSNNPVSITIGVGGAPIQTPEYSDYYNIPGLRGTDTKFGSIVASGGAGGSEESGRYEGNGGSRTTCGGTGNDGRAETYYWVFGGQSSGFSNGGNGTYNEDAQAGGIGSGGGGCFARYVYEGFKSGAGGNGRVVITWN